MSSLNSLENAPASENKIATASENKTAPQISAEGHWYDDLASGCEVNIIRTTEKNKEIMPGMKILIQIKPVVPVPYIHWLYYELEIKKQFNSCKGVVTISNFLIDDCLCSEADVKFNAHISIEKQIMNMICCDFSEYLIGHFIGFEYQSPGNDLWHFKPIPDDAIIIQYFHKHKLEENARNIDIIFKINTDYLGADKPFYSDSLTFRILGFLRDNKIYIDRFFRIKFSGFPKYNIDEDDFRRINNFTDKYTEIDSYNQSDLRAVNIVQLVLTEFRVEFIQEMMYLQDQD